MVRAEFGAVLYNRNFISGRIAGFTNKLSSSNADLLDNNSSDAIFPNSFGDFNKIGPKSPDGSPFIVNGVSSSQSNARCWVNLGYVDGSDKQIPRWFSINQILSFTKINGEEAFDIYNYYGDGKSFGDQTFSDLESDPDLFDTVHDFNYPNNQTSRFYKDLNVIKVMTTNGAKAPPIVNVNQEESNKICNKYKVSVVLKPSDSEEEYFELEEKKKRLPSRKEFIAYSSWPDTFDQEKITKIENRDLQVISRDDSMVDTVTTNIVTQEVGCNINNHLSDGNKKFYTNTISDGDFITSTMPIRMMGDPNKPLPLFYSGSSQLDLNHPKGNIDPDQVNYNSESCVSRFGVQDAVGNIVEKTADRIFCNFDEREMYIQIDDLDFNKSKSILAYKFDISDPIPGNLLQIHETSFDNLELLPTSSRTDEQQYRSLLSAKILLSQLPSVSAHSPMTDNKTYCNVIGAGHTNQSQITYMVDSEIYNPVADYYKSEQGLLGPVFQHFNISVVNDLRNGDGTFLDFGASSSLGGDKKSQALIKYNDIGDEASGNFLFFNPVIGMPLSCKGSSCNNSPDNSLFPRDSFNFGSSSFENTGVNQIRKITAIRQKVVSERHITNIIPNSAGYEDDQIETGSALAGIPAGEASVAFTWEVSDSSYFFFRVGNGGYYKDVPLAGNGRYSFNLGGASGFTEENRFDDTGIRCVVKVNESY